LRARPGKETRAFLLLRTLENVALSRLAE